MARGSARDVTTSFARTLVDEWARAGVRHAALAPGSRSTPLALALAVDDRVELAVFLDERSAAFYALGCSRGGDAPAVVLSTSGTAAVNFHPAVVEAHHSRVPMIVCTADRPPELRDVGAGQTIDQTHLFGRSVRWFSDPGPPADTQGAGEQWRSFAARAFGEATGVVPGPVHLNLPFREPLVPTGSPLIEVPGRPDGRPWTTADTGVAHGGSAVDALQETLGGASRGVIVAGWGSGVAPATLEAFAGVVGWPVLADPISGLRSGPHAVSTYDTLLRSDALATTLAPDVVLQLGSVPTSKVVGPWMDRAPMRVLLGPSGSWPDPGHSAHAVHLGDADGLLARLTTSLAGAVAPDPRWLGQWLDVERDAREVLDAALDGQPTGADGLFDGAIFEGRIARDVVAAPPDSSTLVVASSMPVRDVEAFAVPRHGLRVIANRGANGIDGFVSTALGVAAATEAPTVALLGDLCLLHDSNGLLHAATRDVDLALVVVDNDGGGIFSFLPQADLPQAVEARHFENLFGTPHGIDLACLAELHGIPAERVQSADALAPALTEAVESGGVRMLIVSTDRSTNVAMHEHVRDVVLEALFRER